MVYLFPMGVNRSPADVDDCLRDAEAAGIIERAGGFTTDPSLLAWRGYGYGGRHPSKRPGSVGNAERTWKPGPNAELLQKVCDKPWMQYETEGAWRTPR